MAHVTIEDDIVIEWNGLGSKLDAASIPSHSAERPSYNGQVNLLSESVIGIR